MQNIWLLQILGMLIIALIVLVLYALATMAKKTKSNVIRRILYTIVIIITAFLVSMTIIEFIKELIKLP